MQVNEHTLTTLNVAFNGAFREGFGKARLDHEPFTTRVTSSTAKEEYGWLGESQKIREWVGERTITGLKTHGYEITNKKWERTVGVSRDDIEDDRIGVYSMRMQNLGHSAAVHSSRLVYDVLKKAFSEKCFDGQFMIDTDHAGANGASVSNDGGGSGNPWYLMDCSRPLKPIIFQERKPFELVALDRPDDPNVFMRDEILYGVDGRCAAGFGLWQTIYGSKEPLTIARFQSAYEAMLAFPDDVGEPMGIMPTHLVVGSSSAGAARKVLKAMLIDAGNSNVWMDSVELITTPWLS